jgi:sugar-specific transcriptional regulator TrmB
MMSTAKSAYSLIAKSQANSVDAIAIATGQPAKRVRAVLDHLLREGLIERGAEFRPAMYRATFGSEPPKPVGRPAGSVAREDVDSIVEKAKASRHVLHGVWA